MGAIKDSQHHELLRLVSMGELTTNEYSEITGDKFIQKMEPEQKPKEERPELIKILESIFNMAVLVLFIYGIPYAYKWALEFLNTNIHDWISELNDFAKLMVCAFYVFVAFGFLDEFISGEYDNWIKKNIDPYIIKLKNWLNRRNE